MSKSSGCRSDHFLLFCSSDHATRIGAYHVRSFGSSSLFAWLFRMLVKVAASTVQCLVSRLALVRVDRDKFCMSLWVWFYTWFSAEIWLLRHMPSNLQGTQLITRPKLEAAPNPTWVGLAIFLALAQFFLAICTKTLTATPLGFIQKSNDPFYDFSFVCPFTNNITTIYSRKIAIHLITGSTYIPFM